MPASPGRKQRLFHGRAEGLTAHELKPIESIPIARAAVCNQPFFLDAGTRLDNGAVRNSEILAESQIIRADLEGRFKR